MDVAYIQPDVSFLVNGLTMYHIEHLVNTVSNLVTSTIALCTLEAIAMKEPYLPNTHICVILALLSRGYYHGQHRYIQPLPELAAYLPTQSEICGLLLQKIHDTRAEHIIRDVLDRTVKQGIPFDNIEKLLTNEELKLYEDMQKKECSKKRKIARVGVMLRKKRKLNP